MMSLLNDCVGQKVHFKEQIAIPGIQQCLLLSVCLEIMSLMNDCVGRKVHFKEDIAIPGIQHCSLLIRSD